MGEPVDKSVDQTLVGDDFIPATECQVGSDDCGVCFGSERQVVEEQFGTFFVARDVAELVADHQDVFLKPVLELGEFVLASGFSDHGEQPRHGSEEHGEAALASRDAQSGGDVRLSCSGIAVQHKVASFFDELEGFELGQCGPRFRRQFFAHEIIEIFQLRESSGPYSPAQSRHGPARAPGLRRSVVR